jgi:hypothetical protein
MQRMWRRMFAAVAGVVVVAGLASAQSPPPYSVPNQLPPVNATPAPGYAVPLPAAIPGAPVTPVGATHIRGSGGCSGCASPTGSACGCGLAPVPNASYGAGCGNGCGSIKADAGIVFGSCKSFFNPCGPLPLGHGNGNGCGNGHGGGCGNGGGHGLGGKCGIFPLGKPYNVGTHGCVYDSFLDH